jgi:hypothetical protein
MTTYNSFCAVEGSGVYDSSSELSISKLGVIVENRIAQKIAYLPLRLSRVGGFTLAIYGALIRVVP